MASERTQLWLIEFNDRLQRCDGCRRSWNKPGTLDVWYERFRDWVALENCDAQPDGINVFRKVVEPAAFYACYDQYLRQNAESGM